MTKWSIHHVNQQSYYYVYSQFDSLRNAQNNPKQLIPNPKINCLEKLQIINNNHNQYLGD